VVDDLLIASMAVASTWCSDESKTSPSSSPPGVDDSSDSDASSSGSSDCDTEDGGDDDKEVDGQEEETLGNVDQEDNTKSVSATQNSNDSGEETQSNQAVETTYINPKDTTTEDQNDESANETADSDDDDDDSDIDLTENLANMLDEDDDFPTKKSSSTSGNQKSTFIGPKTENEIDPYTCPTDELEKLNVSVGGSKHDIRSAEVDDDGGIVVDDAIRKSLRIAGTIRSHIVEQRTIVVDSFVPVTLQSQSGNFALDEGSLLVFVTTKDDEGRNIASSLKDDDGSSSYSLQVIGKIMEVFGPVQRPLYVIRLPDPLTSSPKRDTKLRADDTTNPKMNEDGQLEYRAESADDKVMPVTSTEDTNEITIEALEEEAVTSRIDEGDPKEDPWDADGPLTTMLKSCSSIAVYSLMNLANLIDTDQIIRVSGKGCDASNMHDEEVGATELEYSDDEEERQAKGKGKKKPARDNNGHRADINRGRRDGGRGSNRGGRGHWKGGNGNNQVHQTHYQQLHHAYHPQNQTYQGHPPNQMLYQGHLPNQIYQAPPPPQNYAYAQPTPYHNAPQYQQHLYQQQHQYHQQYQQQHQYATPHGVPPPPPPPPPPTQAQAQHGTDSDTVYYDYSGS